MGRWRRRGITAVLAAVALAGIGSLAQGAVIRPLPRIVRPEVAARIRAVLPLRPAQPIQSAWAGRVRVDGVVQAGEWDDATRVTLPHGALRLQNDLRTLYLLIDVTADTGNDASIPSSPWGDYFWLVWDVNGDGNVTPDVDVLYGVYPGTDRLGICYMVRPGANTGLHPSDSKSAMGFGASPDSGTAHRIWEVAINLAEIDADARAWARRPAATQLLRMGLHIHSETPAISDYLPPNLLEDFSRFTPVLLALGPDVVGVGGPIFATVGVIPSTEITGGYATTVPGYTLTVKDAPFGGSLNLFGHFDTLRSLGARYYQVKAKRAGEPDYAPVQESWWNYRWETDRYVAHLIVPDGQGRYEIPPGAEIWSLRDILVRWSTQTLADGMWELTLSLFDASKSPLPGPASGNHLVVMLDNTAPFARINEVKHGGAAVGECAIVTLGPPPDGLRFEITVWDYRGHLGGYSLAGLYGDNRPAGGIAADDYSHHVRPDRQWTGVDPLVAPPVSAAAWRAPANCAYQFRLVAYDRVTDGYTANLHWTEYDKHITILGVGEVLELMGPALGPLVAPPALTPKLGPIVMRRAPGLPGPQIAR